MKAYRINIAGLSNTLHHFDFEIGEDFFSQFETDLIPKGRFLAQVELNKHETFIEADFKISGVANLICDRSLEPFDYPIKSKHKIVFKYGDEEREITDEIIMINREAVTLDIGQYLYEFIGLAIPMKKLHPKFKDEDTEIEGGIVYSSEEEDKKEETIDPRWEQLKKLK